MNKNNMHWRYYLSVESDIDKLSRYIEFSTDNFSTYSIELVRIFLSICSEIDVVMKEICTVLSPNCKTSNICEYQKIIKKELPDLIAESATCSKFRLSFKPWESWKADKSPKWWKHHTDVKHKRSEFYSSANLKNVLESFAALYVANVYLHYVQRKQKSDPFFALSLPNTLHELPVQFDFYRVGYPLAYSFRE